MQRGHPDAASVFFQYVAFFAPIVQQSDATGCYFTISDIPYHNPNTSVMITILYCHPYEKSFNHSMLQAITDRLTDEGREYDVIDLYADHFDPVLSTTQLSMYSKGNTNDENVLRYQTALRQTHHLILMFPIWWGLMPAMLKGFIDKTFLKGIIYDTTPEGTLMPCLTIDRTTIITTSEEDTSIIAPFIEGYLTPLVLNTVGINGVRWFNCDHVKSGTDDRRRTFMAEVLKDIIN